MFLLCIGEATAEVAYALGFGQVSVAGGTAESMIDYILAGYDPGSKFLYVSGQHVRVEIEAALIQHGVDAQRIAVYEAVASQQLSDTLIELLKRRQVDAVTFLSQRAATIFERLLTKAEAQTTVQHLDAFCLSDMIAAPLSAWPWKGIYIAGDTTLASLVASVDNAYN
jgi:uroporphyrinogen-III synthase